MVEVSENARFSLAIDKMRFLAPHISAKETPLLTLTNFTGKHTGTGCADPGDEDPNERVFTIDMLLHSKFAFLFDGSINMDLLKNGLYGVRLTGASFTRRTHNLQSRFLPTDKAVFLLTNDSPFLTCHFTSRLNTITRHTRSPCHCLVLVQAVEPAVDAPRNAYGYRTTRRVRIVQDGVRDECHLVLWDAYTAMADLLEVGDWIGVHDAFVHDGCFTGSKVGPVSIEYGGCTTLFCIVSDRTRKKSETMSQRLSVAKAVEDLPVDDNGNRDFTWYPEQFFLKDIRQNQKNITVLGIIDLMVGNMPIERSPGVKSDRYGVRIRDSQGSVADVTLWDEVGHACHRLQLGQTVLLHNLSTVLKKGTTDKYYVLGGPDDGTTVFSVSTSMGILSSPILRKIVPLCSAGKDGFYARAVIKSWQTPPEGKLSEYIHPTCTRPLDVKNNIYFCKFCNIFPPHDGVHSILCSLTLDDGTARVDTLVRHRVAEELLNVGAAEFCGCPNARRLELLNALVGREVEVHISGFLDKKTKQLVRRIDAVLPVSNTAVETCN